MIQLISRLPLLQFLLLLTLFALCNAFEFQNVSQPQLDYSSFDNRIGFFGSFSAVSIYKHLGSSSVVSFFPATQNSNGNRKRDEDDSVSSASQKEGLYIRDEAQNASLKLADVNGQVKQLLRLSDETVVINGDFTSFNGQSVRSPIIYNISANSTTEIIPSSEDFEGRVNTIFVDGDLIYLGGNFTFNNTVGAAIYSQSSKSLNSTLFQGFGQGATINSIVKIFDNDNNNDSRDGNRGSIIFGGKFNTLGLSDLLVHNITTNNTSNHNQSNSSIVNAEQIISLRHGTFTDVNAQNPSDNSLIICPADNHQWAAIPNSGAEWRVELPDEMKGLTPTKARIYIPDSSNGVKLFRIYSYPNNGIMNLTYVDPVTHELTHCDAWCPLLSFNSLNDAIDSNIENAADLNQDDVFVDEDDGTFFKYYDPSTMTKNLGYAANFQEFAFVDQVGFDAVGITVVDWYGDQGVLAGFELYQNAITVYGNNTLNEPNCNFDMNSNSNNYAEIVSGNFNSIRNSHPGIANDYLVTYDTTAKINLYPNISYSGDYSIIMITPGCLMDDSCAQRAIVNVTVVGIDDTILSSNLIYQNNENTKFDYLFFGHMNSSDSHANRIEVSYSRSVVPEAQNPIMVVDKIVADIVSLDSYYNRNFTNNTRRTNGSDLAHIQLSGLFEYSLANFTNFDEELVHYEQDNRTLISLNNTFVGNSSINVLSGRLSNNTEISEISLYDGSGSGSILSLLGNFESNSTNLTLSNSNFISLNISSYNSTTNETAIDLPRSLKKRDTHEIQGATFNDSILKTVSVQNGQGLLFLGKFTMTNADIRDLSANNATTTSSQAQANNFVLYSNNQWFSFGNEFENVEFDQFTNTTIAGTEYYVFSSRDSIFRTWNNTGHAWSDRGFNITQAARLDGNQQIIGGNGFNVMDLYSQDQAYIQNSNLDKFGINVSSAANNNNSNSIINKSFYVNSTLSVIGGKFESNSVKNVGMIDNNNPGNNLQSLQGDLDWDPSTVIEALYVDSNGEYLFMGVNGSVAVDGENVTGLVVYDLQNSTFMSTQPAALSKNDGSPIHVNSVVLYDDGDKLLVGGDFDNAGSLSCPSLCVYDLANTRWINPQSQAESSTSISGVITDMKFYSSNQVLIAGRNLTLSNSGVFFLTYNFNNGAFGTKSSLNSLSKTVDRFVLNDRSNSNLDGRMIAMGDGYIAGYDGSKWSNIDQSFDYSNNQTVFDDMKLLDLAKSSSYRQTYFDNDKTLLIAGTFALDGYGLANMAFYNGTAWIPYVYTTSPLDSTRIGEVKSILVNDAYRFQSSNDLKNLRNYLSKGKVVGISLACALGSTALLGLLYIIPYFALLKNRKGYVQRIHESDMMQAVNPEDLIHEIDLQREK
ncbi:uncharacterized protein LODBEIA_P13970 [Lodderomyces beijingensis]|uniref:Bud site selection protein RAX2 n=1 Tax=Lodderomyces beijingensis TaxID=1775926 RepID=A0ABP0ZHR0_9ASCO